MNERMKGEKRKKTGRDEIKMKRKKERTREKARKEGRREER